MAITKKFLQYSSASINYYGLWIECGLAMDPLFDFVQLRAACKGKIIMSFELEYVGS